MDFLVVVHEGAGTTEEIGDGCRIACEAAFRKIENGAGSRMCDNFIYLSLG
jgi:hypothetical protein